MKDLIETILCLSVLIIIGIGFYKLSEKFCEAKAEALGYKYEYGFMKGCIYIDKDGNKFDSQQVRYQGVK